MSFFISLVEMTDASRRDLEALPKVHSLMHHGLPLAEYRAMLHDIYHIVRQFCPVMELAAARCTAYPEVLRELRERIVEERGHEAWVLEDVEAVGGDVDAVRANPPSAPVQAMIAFNYHGAEHGQPCSVLGMLYMLEVVSSVYGGRVADSIAQAIQRSVEGAGFKFLLSHASMDAEHMAKLNRLVKTIADQDAQSAIVNSTRVNFFQFGQMFGASGFISHLTQQP
jgi:pyrroloquinoline quinone (PQQ) biosynthesis protein C